MSVAQLCQHVAEHLEELALVHLVAHAYLIFIIYMIPVKSVLMLFVGKEAVVLVDDFPKRLEVARRCVGAFLRIDAGDKEPRAECQEQDVNMFHRVCGIMEKRLVMPISTRWV